MTSPTFSLYFTNHGYVAQDTYATLDAAVAAAKRAGFDCSIVRGYRYDRATMSWSGDVVASWSILGGLRTVRA